MSLIPSFLGNNNRSILEPFSSDIWSNSEVSAAWANARVDWRETPERHVLEVELPGLKKEEVKVEVEEGRVVLISGERSVEREEKNERWHRLERARGKFQRKFLLPQNAILDQLKASLQNGVLTVTVPKVMEKKHEVKTIEITG